MQRLTLAITCWLMLSGLAAAQDGGFQWPFMGKKKTNTQTKYVGLPSIGSVFTKDKPASDSNFLKLPSPTKMMNRMEERTDAMFAKTRSTWNGMKQRSRSLNPFSATPKKKKKSSFLNNMFSKKESSAPSTIDEFMRLPRPEF